MLEYLFLRDYDLTRPLRPRLSNGKYIRYSLDGRVLTSICGGTILRYIDLPVLCIAVHQGSVLGNNIFLLGNDGRIYQAHDIPSIISTYGSWPDNLSGFLLE